MNLNFYVAIGLDVLTVAIVGYCVYAAARKGLLRTIAQLAAYMLIVLAASLVSRAVSPVLYDRLVEPMLLGEKPMSNATFALASHAVNPELLEISPPGGGLLELLPKGVDLDYWIGRAEDSVEDFSGAILEELLESTVRPAAVNAISAICFTVVFCVLSVLANLLLSATGVIRYIPVIGRINSFLGAVFGALEGILLVWLAALFLQGLLTLGQGEWWIFTEKAARNTWIFRYFFDPPLLNGISLPF